MANSERGIAKKAHTENEKFLRVGIEKVKQLQFDDLMTIEQGEIKKLEYDQNQSTHPQ
jgi:hypothetical protein